MGQHVKEALEQGYICPSTSLASASIFFVKKRMGGLRPCLNYRGLNKLLIQYLYYEYLVLPYGLATAPSVLQAYINEALREFLGRFVVTYIDDILIYSTSWDQHVCDVRAIVHNMLKNFLYCKAEKCEFHMKEINVLGYIIQEGSVRMQPGKVEAVKAWLRPHTRKALQCFLRFANFYRRFIKFFSTLAQPLTHLLWGQNKRLNWNPRAVRSFEELKNAFSTAPVLRQPDPKKPFVVDVDTLNVGVRAVLSQQQDKGGKLHPIAFFSQKLSPGTKLRS
ncbi:hypothetical protein P4O66_005342 [Electrophorus voltai]|uniref:ribonuclease H n=1 Tax=Electrophorus voltai TaxID=2609070 RepID=A0AAD8ZZ31_9TELE|nr:hypothetical protein P4O66_005342 [Electrophorus voltai]